MIVACVCRTPVARTVTQLCCVESTFLHSVPHPRLWQEGLLPVVIVAARAAFPVAWHTTAPCLLTVSLFVVSGYAISLKHSPKSSDKR
jgi:hypothetical protein